MNKCITRQNKDKLHHDLAAMICNFYNANKNTSKETVHLNLFDEYVKTLFDVAVLTMNFDHSDSNIVLELFKEFNNQHQ